MSPRPPGRGLVAAAYALSIVAVTAACGESEDRSVEGRWQIADIDQIRQFRLRMLEDEAQRARDYVDDLDAPFRPEVGGMDGLLTLGEFFAENSLASSTPEQRRAWAAVVPRWELALDRWGVARIEVDGEEIKGTWRRQRDRVIVSLSPPPEHQSMEVSLLVEGDHLVMEIPKPHGRLRLRRTKLQ